MSKASLPLLTARQAKIIDLKANKIFGISTLILMENAGRAVMQESIRIIRDKPAKVAFFCGKGNNGGDGLVAARHFLSFGIKPDIFLAGKITDVKNEARVNLDILLRLKQKITEVNYKNLHLVKNKISRYSLIVDALFGVGLNAPIAGIFKSLIEIINSSRAFILSVDIPSGLDATTGDILEACIKADETVTFVAKKYGMSKGNGKKYCGKVLIRDLGIPLNE